MTIDITDIIPPPRPRKGISTTLHPVLLSIIFTTVMLNYYRDESKDCAVKVSTSNNHIHISRLFSGTGSIRKENANTPTYQRPVLNFVQKISQETKLIWHQFIRGKSIRFGNVQNYLWNACKQCSEEG